MTLPIDKNDIEGFRYVCTNHNLRFYTVPTDNPAIVEIMIRHRNGSEPTPAFALCIGRQVEAKLEELKSIDRIKEFELMQHSENRNLIDVLP